MAAAQQVRGVVIAEAARRLGVGEDAIRIWIQAGGVDSAQIDGVWYLALPAGPDDAAPTAVATPDSPAGDGAAVAHPDVLWLREQLAARDRTIAALTERLADLADLAGRGAAPAAPAPPVEPPRSHSDGAGASPPDSIAALKTSLDNLAALTRSDPAVVDGAGIAAGEGWRAGASRWTAKSGSIWVFFTAVLSVVVYAALAVADVMKGVGVVVNGGHMEAATTLAGLLAIPATLWMNRPVANRAPAATGAAPRR
ncbi:MAG TPA: hypothetical protein VFU81_17990 [Thermomicrobiales bacterium]|nr:hypothetical protein [Thermomicrobiales bacterium]